MQQTGIEEKQDTGIPNVPSSFPAKFSCDTKLRQKFPSVVYMSNPAQFKESQRLGQFNFNKLDLKPFFGKLKAKNERVDHNELLQDCIEPYCVPTDQTLMFESRFESGNLAIVSKVSQSEYNLLLQTDTNSRGHTQWFYFRVRNTTSRATVKFNILNFAKPNSLHNDCLLYTSDAADE